MTRPNGAATGSDEIDRILALDSYAILDTPSEEAFDDLAALAADICATPMSAISFIDINRQWIKARRGFDVSETSRDTAICAHTIEEKSLMEVPDTLHDERFRTFPAVVGDPSVRFYAGVPLVTVEGHALGALCVMDCQPRTLSPLQRRTLVVLAAQVVTELELRRQARDLAAAVTARLAAEAARREQQSLLEGVLKHTDVCVYTKDVEGRYVMINPAFERAIGNPPGMMGRTDHDSADDNLADEFHRNDQIIVNTRQSQVFIEDLIHADGSLHTYRSTKFPLIADDGKVVGIAGVSTDVTELAAARAAHAAAENRWRTLVEQLPMAVILTDEHGVLTYLNADAVILTGAQTPEQLVSTTVFDLAPDNLREDAHTLFKELLSGELSGRARRGTLRRLDGSEVTVEFSGNAVEEAGVRNVHLQIRDVTATAAIQAALKQTASTDALTGLLNRRAWQTRTPPLIADAVERNLPMTIAIVDLDHFKAYNDAHGHAAGDTLLQRFASVATTTLRDSDVLARWGGDEFLIAMPNTTSHDAKALLERIQRAVPAGQTCSIGYTTYHPHEPLIDTVNRADKALYQSKHRGRDQINLLLGRR